MTKSLVSSARRLWRPVLTGALTQCQTGERRQAAHARSAANPGGTIAADAMSTKVSSSLGPMVPMEVSPIWKRVRRAAPAPLIRHAEPAVCEIKSYKARPLCVGGGIHDKSVKMSCGLWGRAWDHRLIARSSEGGSTDAMSAEPLNDTAPFSQFFTALP